MIHACLIPNAGHRDQVKNPSASLNWNKLTYKCLGCGASGGLLWFIATVRGGDTDEARKWLEGVTGTGSTLMDLDALMRFFDALYGPKASPPPMPTYSEQMLNPWLLIHPYLTDEPKWVERDGEVFNVGGRGIPEETVVRFKVGYAERYEVSRHTHSERIVLPQFWDGKLVGWQSRRLGDDGTPKFLSSPDFPKDTTLYNYDPSQRWVLMVEAVMSVLRHAHHLHVESTFGASITERQIRLMSRHENVVLGFDNDTAGWKATTQVGDALMPHCNVWVMENPYAADPADLPVEIIGPLARDPLPYALWSPPKSLIPWRG